MAHGTRTATTVDGTPDFKRVSIHYVDVSGDLRSVSSVIAAGDTDTEIEALVDALQDATQASIYEVSVAYVYTSTPDAQNAVAGSRDSVYDNVVTLYKNAAAQISRDLFIPAPAPEIMNGDLDEIDATSTELLAVYTALAAVSSGYQIVSARYTERREINKRVLI